MFFTLSPIYHPLPVCIFVLLLGLFLNWTPLHPLVSFFNPLSLSSTPYVTNSRTGISYRGTLTKGVEHFQNIFYAQDTSGSHRFTPPVPFLPPPGTIIDATIAGAVCPQGMGPAPLPFASPITNVSENCLSLRIARPSGFDASTRLPVLVWIHGGGNALGTASDQMYQPDGLVQQARLNGQPVIFVGINYRLGIFGYATNNALKDAKQANAGLRDQRAAFDWIRDNIEAFGGDPENITAIGQSVGASSIGLHLVSYRGRRGVPFQKAIMMSGASGLNFNIMSNLVANNTALVARSLDCTQDDPDSEAIIECLRAAPFEKLMNVSVSLARQMRPPFGELAFYPSYDGDYIPDRPSVLLRNGDFVKDIPIIASWVSNDGAWYAPPSITSDASVLASFSTFVLGLSKASLQRFLSLYPVSDFAHLVRSSEGATAQYYRAAQINRDIWFTCPVIDFTWQYARHGSSNVRLYEMNQTRFGPIFEYMGIPHWRVSHLSDIPYILNGDVAAGGDNSPEQQRLSALLSGSSAAFAHIGDPTVSKGQVLSDWPIAYQGQSKQAMQKEHPEEISVYVIGGPHGNGPGKATREESKAGSSERERALAWERLIERCSFISSIQEEIGV